MVRDPSPYVGLWEIMGTRLVRKVKYLLLYLRVSTLYEKNGVVFGLQKIQ